MSVRFWVLEQLFKVLAAIIDWEREKEELGYDGPEQDASERAGPLQLRWLMHPSLGLPRLPFGIWRNRAPRSGMSKQELADLPGWDLVETVGLPVDQTWDDTDYYLDEQGLAGDERSAQDAALQRLHRGAPRIGWPRLSAMLGDGQQHFLPDWEPVDLDAYLRDLLQGRLLAGVHSMLRDRPDRSEHAAYTDSETDPGSMPLTPHLLLTGVEALRGRTDAATSAWHPLGLLLLAAGGDPLASLAFGFGTAIPQRGEPDDIYMVSMPYQLENQGGTFEFHLADVITFDDDLRPPERPRNVSARLVGHTRPQVVDGPALDSVGVSWQRALNPAFAIVSGNRTAAMGYAVGRLGLQPPPDAILLSRRPDEVKGWLPFVASKPAEAQPVLFCDQRRREAVDDEGTLIGDPLAYEHIYAVAAQDVFGRYSPWSTTTFAGGDEPPQTPSILAVTLDPSGLVTVDFGWDWSDRSPEFIELVGAYTNDPSSPVLSELVEFRGDASPSFTGGDVIPLDPDRKPADDWGAPQDREPDQPEARFYRLTIGVALDFLDQRQRELEVRARGQCHLHERASSGWNVGPFTSPGRAVAYDPAPPPPPAVPEAPQWGSLPDSGGVSRALLRWPGDQRVAGYALYEATETSLLAALGRPGPDTTRPLHERLAELRAADLPRLRSVFRRVRKELIPAATPTTSFEVALPRGSTVLHLYAVTAVSRNQVESAWPSSSRGFIAVGAPRLAVPSPPFLEADADTTGAAPVVHVRARAPGEPVAERIELYRIAHDGLAADVDTMGPPVVTLAGAQATFADPGLAYGWRRVWYRAVAWSARDDLHGVVEARSKPSAAVSVLPTPPSPPQVTALRVNEPGSSAAEALISFATNAPAAATSIGSHVVVVEGRANTGAQTARVEGRLDALPAVASLAELPAPNPADRRVVRVGTPEVYRLYAWLPRPAADQTFTATVKVIDPLGRMGRTDADVPAPLVLQPAWRRCKVCQGLVYSGFGAALCLNGEPHDFSGSPDYSVPFESAPPWTQTGWWWCRKCEGLFLGADAGFCVAGGRHDPTGSAHYSVPYGDETTPGTEPGWRFCERCTRLIRPVAGDGDCFDGGPHELLGSGNYSVYLTP